jgi:serine protease Do
MKKMILLFSTFLLLALQSIANPAETQNSFIQVAEKVMPAVVNINTEKTIQQRYVDPFEELFNDPFFGRSFRRKQTPKDYKRKTTSLGSGFVISEDGYIITNNHVIDGADKIEVAFNNKEKYEAKIIGTDPDSDVAVLKIKSDKKTFPYLSLGNSDSIKVGQWAIAIGNPFGLNNTMTAGIISAKGRSGMGIENYEDFIQTDASINPGNSGGPLVDINGDVIGINTAILSKSGGNVGIGFAIPINMAKTITNSIIENGEFERGWLGVQIQDLDHKMAGQFGLDKAKGVLITQIFKDSPASKAGIQIGDVILEVDYQKVSDVFKFKNLIGNKEPNSNIRIKLIRNKKEQILSVKLGKRSESSTIEKNEDINILGMHLKNLDNTLKEKFGYEDIKNGVVILEVDYNSEAYSYGIRPGSVILQVNHKKVNNAKTILDIYNKTKDKEDILFFIASKNSNKYVILNKQQNK